MTGDGVAELITGPGRGGGPHVRVWSVASGRLSDVTGFFPYYPGFAGGVAVAAGDVTGDGVAELITGAGQGGGDLAALRGVLPDRGVSLHAPPRTRANVPSRSISKSSDVTLPPSGCR